MKMNGVQLQRQPTGCTCVHACLAMALGVDVLEVVDDLGGEALNSREIVVRLHRAGVRFTEFLGPELVLVGWYFLAVPSLNIRGGMHEILAHVGPGGITGVLDPSRKVVYKSDGSDLVSWAEAIWFEPVVENGPCI